MQKIEVDVIILSWNRVEDTIEAIRSAAEQEGISKQIQIVDQGSEPGNLQRLEAFLANVPCARLEKLGFNSGVAEGRNIAAGMGNAPYIVALDSDAVFADRFAIVRAVNTLDADPSLCALGFKVENFFTGEIDKTCWVYEQAEAHPDRSFFISTFVGGANAMRRSTFEAVGAYDGSLFFCGEETDLSYRLLNTGLRIKYMPTVVVRHRVTPERRIYWNKGRYFYSVRNALYSRYKYGDPASRLFTSSIALILRGWSNGMPVAPLRAIAAAIPMCLRFRRSPRNRQSYQLSLETKAYIQRCEPSRNDSWRTKLRRQFVHLPRHG